MININSATQPINNSASTASTTNNSSASSFSDILSEQLAKTAEPEKNQQPNVLDDPLSSSEKTTKASAQDELSRILAMSPAELMRYQILSQMGLTEEALQEMPKEERTKIEELIKEKIEEKLGISDDSEEVATKIL
jgi:hypothetical protein